MLFALFHLYDLFLTLFFLVLMNFLAVKNYPSTFFIKNTFVRDEGCNLMSKYHPLDRMNGFFWISWFPIFKKVQVPENVDSLTKQYWI